MATSISISGPLLSSVLFEHSIAESDQDGFLIGETLCEITDTISDSQISDTKREIRLKICNFIPCELFAFYDSAGNPCIDDLKFILGDNLRDVIGWYRCRRNTGLNISLRERILHQNLVKSLARNNQNIFILGLFTNSLSSGNVLHDMCHSFYQMDTVGEFTSLPFRTYNLGEVVQHYRCYPQAATGITTGEFGKLLSSMERPTGSAVAQMLNLSSNLGLKLKELRNQVGSLEHSGNELERSVSKLRALMLIQRKTPSPSFSQFF